MIRSLILYMCIMYCLSLLTAVCNTDLSDTYLSRVSMAIAQQVRSVDELALSLGVRMSQHATYRTLEEQLLHLLKIWRDTKNGTKQRLVGILQQHHLLLQDSARSHQQQYVQPKKGVCV